MFIGVSESRTVPLPPEAAFDGTVAVALPAVLGHRHLAIPKVVRVEGQDGTWGREVGQTRTICTSDGGSLHETLRELDRPHSFGYRLEQIRGPMRPLVGHIDGTWAFASAGAGTLITWSWELSPTSPIAAPVVVLLARMWRGYARRALATLESVLVTA